MSSPNGGWSKSEHAKTADEIQIRYGSNLIAQESLKWGRYVIVTTPSAHNIIKNNLDSKPEAVEYARNLDYQHLQQITDKFPDDAQLVVGVGGGTALDASKYVALTKNVPLILVPTIVSTGAIVHSVFARWNGHHIVGHPDTWPWLNCEEAIVDSELVLKAPPYLNTAGLGDILCSYSGVAEWKYNAINGNAPTFDQSAVEVNTLFHQDIVNGFPLTLSSSGELSVESVQFIMQGIQDRDSKGHTNPHAIQGDHDFAGCIEGINGKGWVHGELVALGSIIIAWHCDQNPEFLIKMLDICKVRHRPSEMGISKEELRKGLEFAPIYMSDQKNGRDTQSILRLNPITGTRFDDLWVYLERN